MRKAFVVLLLAASLFAASAPSRSTAQESSGGSSDWLIYGALGFGLFELLKPHHHPSPSPTPILHAPETPLPCGPKITDGWFEPTQGVWQDDNVFDDHPTKQLTRTADEPPAYNAELAMITDRDTRFFGVKHYRRNGREVLAGYYGIIHMAGTTDCDGTPQPVRMRFSVETGSHGQVVWTSPAYWKIPLTGKRVPEQEWHTDLNASDGVPRYPEAPYRFLTSGPYTIVDELITDQGPTGLKVTVSGKAHPTVVLRVGFLVVFLKGHHEAGAPGFELSDVALFHDERGLARDSQTFIPDFYPLREHGWVSRLYPHDMDLTAEPYVTSTIAPVSLPGRDQLDVDIDTWHQREKIQAAISKELDLDTLMGGYDRMVAVLHPEDMKFISPGASGLAFSQKVVLVEAGYFSNFTVVAHEIAHTLPYIWSSGQMKQECTAPGNYHNSFERLASGMRLDNGGKPSSPDFLYNKVPFMGSATQVSGQWADQCTYWHLADELQRRPDPAVLVVRGGIGKFGRRLDAVLWPAYTVKGNVSIPHGTSAWSIVVRDSGGKIAGTYPFAPQFLDENGKPKAFAPFMYQIPQPKSLGSIELRGPGVSIVRKAARFAPSISITRAQVVGSNLTLGWRVTADPATAALSSVFVSNDGGLTYNAWLTEQPKTALTVPIGRGKHRLKVVVTDGTRSAEAFADVTRP